MKYAGSDWVQNSLKKEMSSLGVSVADLLGELYRGIYHLDSGHLNKVDWTDKRYMEILIGRSLATYDSDDLTRLVFLAHQFCVRVQIEPCNFRYIKMSFSPRQRGGSIFTNHPAIDQALEQFQRTQ